MVAVWDLLNHVTGAANVRLHHDPEKGVLQVSLAVCVEAETVCVCVCVCLGGGVLDQRGEGGVSGPCGTCSTM